MGSGVQAGDSWSLEVATKGWELGKYTYFARAMDDLGEWGEVGTLVLLIAGTVWLMDIISAKIRERIV